jgi:CTP:molybdopterin cytidylyltransferase MocA
MGRPKAALPLGPDGQTVLARAVASLLDAGVPRVVVVAGAYPVEVRAALGRADRRVAVCDNAAWREGQLSSLLCGLAAVDSPWLEGVLMTLADVPLVTPGTIRRVMRAWRESGALIVRPARGGEHGHPVLFDRRLFAELRTASPDQGAKPVVRAHAAATVNVEVEDEGAFFDLDDPADYERALSMARATWS